MASLRNTWTDERRYLRSHHTFGRKLTLVDTLIPEPRVSKIHAAITWSGEHWQLRDISRNGTWLDDKKLVANQSIPLSVGQIIRFAEPEGPSWGVDDLAPPSDLLIGINSKSETQELQPYHLLPNDEEPCLAVYFCQFRQQWLLEYLDQAQTGKTETFEKPLFNGSLIAFNGYRWSLLLQPFDAPTEAVHSISVGLDNYIFEFDVSLDEEHVCLQVVNDGQSIDLLERSHHYLLLHLVRAMAKAIEQNIDEANRGWIHTDVLAHELGIEVTHINILIFRARKQLGSAFVDRPGLAGLLERRRGTVRFNCLKAVIVKGRQREIFDFSL